MTREDVIRNIFLAIIFAISGFLGIANGSYIVSIMYILTVVILVVFILKDKDLYNMFYTLLLISAFYDYTLYVPRVQSVYLFHIVLGIFTLMSLFRIFKDRQILMDLDRKVLAIYVLWFIYMCVSIIWSLNKSLSIKYIAIYLMMFAFIVNMMVYNINRERIKKTITILSSLILLIILIGFVEVILGTQLPVKHYADAFIEFLPKDQQNLINARPIAFSFNPNNLAATLAILLPIGFYAIYKFENIFFKVVCIIASIIAFSLISITTSRTGFVAAAFGVIVYLIYSVINIKRIGLKGIVCPLILVISLFVAFKYSYMIMNIAQTESGQEQKKNGLADKLDALGEQEIQEGGDGSLNVRWTIVSDVLRGTIKEKHYLGYGVGNVEQYIKNQGNTGNIYSPHCYPIEILGDFGLPGLALYGIYYLYLLIQNMIIGIKKKSPMCFAAVTGLIAFAPASFGPSSITYVFSYWMLMGFAVACIQVYKKESDEYRPTSSSSMKEYRIG
ncbi:O-antigen polymerase [Clostridium sp. MF28]|uniref:O-antigen ligase family protein n=1 Tax=Clostridium TaxID=1485 RepID=UPI000CFA6D12|nr:MULTISPECIES: O-antigen ligase family protein [Clostridium]AVK48556.1 O-antigen polymerase [Clostridium sp. MF28]PSM58923.1 O-antigen polymerase [Clostridium diolis]